MTTSTLTSISYGPDRFRLAIERQLGREGPAGLEKPSSTPTICWKVDSDPFFRRLLPTQPHHFTFLYNMSLNSRLRYLIRSTLFLSLTLAEVSNDSPVVTS